MTISAFSFILLLFLLGSWTLPLSKPLHSHMCSGFSFFYISTIDLHFRYFYYYSNVFIFNLLYFISILFLHISHSLQLGWFFCEVN